jgi:hypothetical protein
MPGLDPGIQRNGACWIAGSSPAMTKVEPVRLLISYPYGGDRKAAPRFPAKHLPI